MMRFLPARMTVVLVALCLSACGENSVKVYGDQTEHDANEMVLVLRRHNVEATKVAEKASFNVMVPETEFSDAVTYLNSAGLPRQKHASVTDLFPSGNMFSTPAEVEIRARYALEQQISSNLSSVPGVQSAQVLLAMPPATERGATVQTSASVLLVFDSRFDSEGLVARVRQFVKNSVPNLALDNISVSIFRAQEPTARSRVAASDN